MTGNDKEFRSLALRTGACLLLFLALYVVLSFLYTSTVLFSFTLESPVLSDVISEVMLGIGYFLTFVIPAIVFVLFTDKENMEKRKFTKTVPGRSAPAVIIFAISTGGLAFSYLNDFLLPFFRDDNSEIIAETDPMMLHEILLLIFTSAIIPAIAEEILFRKTILSNLIPYGKTFAIISSALLFGLMHQNVSQILYTTVAGIIFGYVYVKTESFLCVFLIHFTNNLVSAIQQVIISNVSAPLSMTIVIIINAITLILGAASLLVLAITYRKKKDIYATGSFGTLMETSPSYVQKKLSFEPTLKFFTSPTVMIFTIICVLTIFIQFIRL